MAERRFTVRLDAEMNISQVKSAVQTMQTELSKLNLPQDVGSKLAGTFDKLTGEIERFQAMSAKGIGSSQEFNQLANSGNKILQLYEQLSNQVRSLGNLSDGQLQKMFPPSALANIQKANAAMQQYTNATKGSEKQIERLEREIAQAEKATEKLRTQKEKLEGKSTVSDTTFKQMEKDADAAEREFREAEQALKDLQQQAQDYEKKSQEKYGSTAKARQSSTYRDIVDKSIPDQEKEVARLEQAWERLKNKRDKALTQTKKDEAIAQLVADIQKAEGNVATLQSQLDSLKAGDPQAFQQLIAQLNQIKGISLDPTSATIEQVQQAVARLSQQELEQLKNSFLQAGNTVNGTRGQFQGFQQQIDQTRTKVNQLDSAMGEVDMLKSRISYFFGLTNSVYLLRRAITSAFETVKELDKTMTEAAVVTDFSVSDMWDKLPQYANEANKLGTSINSLYAATTLYYQQGLKTNEAMSLGIETMKMARIAGMESAEATEAMTAALRGFNMELNEASATRVNDVYSKLAAITASDTEQIATAMTKTASIANAANMEFETTAALLAQIIETTQEAPETAGTAMKTIIARFTEVKELFSQGQLTGEDSEGEEININKIDAALKTVGISLKDFLNGSKGIDDIFLELAEKWDSLDLATQRYIATMAAGSRQQSRFIAMMSDYDRTMELVGAANNSAGASQQQFNKTLESLDSKLEKLGVAWDTFLMGIADNEIIKDMIDLLADLINLINQITTLGGKSSDSFSIITKLGLTVVGLRGAKALLGKGITALVSSFTSAGSDAGVGFFQGFRQSFAFRGNRAEIFSKDLKLAFDPVQYADASGGRLQVQQNMQALGAQYHLTSSQVDELTNSMANGNTATQTSNAFLAKNQALLKQQRLQMLKSTLTIVALVAAIAIVLSLVEEYKKKVDDTYETSEEKLQALTTLENDLTDSTDKLSESLKNLGNTKTEFKGLVKELKNLKKGTADWASKMHEARTQMLDIFETYPELRKYTETVNGITVLTNEGWEKYEQALTDTYYNQMQSLYGTKMTKNWVERVQRAEQLDLQTNTVTAREEAKIQKGTTYGGYAGGAALGIAGYIGGSALGAKLGGTVGTIAGPIGTVVGALLGVILGALIGKVAGGSLEATKGVDPAVLNSIAEKASLYQKDDNKIGFSAQEAMQQENGKQLVEDFLADQGLEQDSEDFKILTEYITENAQEFDEHTAYLAQANAELLLFGKNLGDINAEKRGYTGETAETYSAITAELTTAEFKNRYDNEYAELVERAKNQGSEISQEKFTITDQKLIDEFLKNHDQEFELKNNKIYYKGSETEISDATFLGKLATDRVNLDIEKKTDEIFDVVGHSPATGDLYQWMSTSDGLSYKGEVGDATLPDLSKMLTEGYKVLAQAKTIPEFEDLYWQAFQAHWGKDSSPVAYSFWSRHADTLDYGGSDYTTDAANSKKAVGPSDYTGSGDTFQRIIHDPNDYGSAKEWIHSYRREAAWYDYLDGGTAATLWTENDGNIFHTKITNDGKASRVDQADVEKWAISSGKFTDNALAWSIYWKDGIDTFKSNLEDLTNTYNKLQKYTYTEYQYITGYNEQTGETTVETRKDGYGFTFLKDVDWENATLFIDSINGLVQAYGNLSFETMSEWLNNIANAIPEVENVITDDKLRSEVLNMIAATDLKDLNDLRETRVLIQQKAQEAGYDDEEILKAYDEMTAGLEELGIAISKLDIDQLIETLDKSTKIANKIRKEDENKNVIFNEEELQALLGLGIASRNDFFLTEDGYIYLGESMEELRQTILETNQILLGQQIDALRAKVDTGQDLIDAGVGSYAWGAVSTWDSATIDKVFEDMWTHYGLGDKSTENQIREALKGTPLENIDVNVIKQIIVGGFDDLE